MGEITMKVTIDVQGEEGFDVVATWQKTNLQTVILVENAIMDALKGINGMTLEKINAA